MQRTGGSHQLGIECKAAGRQAYLTLSLSSGTSGTTYISHTARGVGCRGFPRAARTGGRDFAGYAAYLSAPAWHSYAAIQPFIAMHFGMPCVVVSGTYLPRFADRIVDAILNFRPSFVTMFLPMVFSIIARPPPGLKRGSTLRRRRTLVVTGAPITPGMRPSQGAYASRQRRRDRRVQRKPSRGRLCARRGTHLVPDTCYAEVIGRETRRPVADGEPG